jgi:hypothetical protein
MINPTPAGNRAAFKIKLVGFNNRRYDNHIFWARYRVTQPAAVRAEQKLIVEHNNNYAVRQAYNLSYADIWDFSRSRSRV